MHIKKTDHDVLVESVVNEFASGLHPVCVDFLVPLVRFCQLICRRVASVCDQNKNHYNCAQKASPRRFFKVNRFA